MKFGYSIQDLGSFLRNVAVYTNTECEAEKVISNGHKFLIILF
jgi:hypothetical protein